MKQSRPTFREIEPEPEKQNAALKPLRSVLLLQAMRKVMADADVIVARRQFQACQEALEEEQNNLNELIDHTQRERSESIEKLKKTPSDIWTLVCWQERTKTLLTDIDTHQAKAHEAGVNLQDSEQSLKSSLQLRRQIELRQCKYEEILKSLREGA